MAQHQVCSESDIAIGELKPFKVEGKKILVSHTEEGFFATQANCTHMFLPLKSGKLENCVLQCPFHRARFDVRTGEVVDWASFPPGIQVMNIIRSEKSLETYPVECKDGQVFVELG